MIIKIVVRRMVKLIHFKYLTYAPKFRAQHCNNILVICNNTKENFLCESEEMNVKFHKKCENTGKILKISCVTYSFVKFDIFYFLGLP